MSKKSFGDCDNCPLKPQVRVVGETNCEDDLSKVEVLVLAEAPSHEEIKKDRPLVGKAGKIFREAFESSGMSELPYYISNVVLCANIGEDNKTYNPPDDAIEKCKPNWQKLIEITKPKVIITMGNIPMKVLGIADAGVTKLNGKVRKYKEHSVFVLVHPSYIQRNGGIESEEGIEFKNNFTKLVKALTNEVTESKSDVEDKVVEEKPKPVKEKKEVNGNKKVEIIKDLDKPYTFKLPSWCYSEDYCLIDIENIKGTNTILYIFRDKEGNKKYYQESSNDKYYYVGTESVLENAPMIENIKNVYLVKTDTPFREEEKSTYEEDVRPELKRAIDYRIERGNTPECNVELKKLFYDIEVYSEGRREFPDPKLAPSPVNAISFQVNDGDINVWIAKHNKMDKSEIKKDFGTDKSIRVQIFENERELLNEFFREVKKINPDIVAAWNGLGFDIITLYERARKCDVNVSRMSPLDMVYINSSNYGEVFVYGIHFLDMLDLYKELTYISEESYKLDYIAQKVLGKGKVAYEGSLDKLYETDINKFIEYSGVDTYRLYELDKALGHIDLKFELIRICSSTWKASRTTMGLVDPMCVSYAKQINMVCRTAVEYDHSEITSIPGGYVRNPIPGLHGYVIDLDFTALYPSIICTFNIGPNTYVGKIDRELARGLIYFKDKLKRDVEIDYIENPLMRNSVKKKMTIGELVDHIEKENLIINIAGTLYKSHDQETSFFFRILRYILDSRKEYKELMSEAMRNKNDMEAKRLKNIQMAYKILANSLFGALANDNFRMFNLDMATSITLSGQESIKFIGYHLNNYLKNDSTKIVPNYMNGYEDKKLDYLIYTDTDSVFIALGDYLADKEIIKI